MLQNSDANSFSGALHTCEVKKWFFDVRTFISETVRWSACDLRRLTNWLFGAADWKQSAIESSVCRRCIRRWNGLPLDVNVTCAQLLSTSRTTWRHYVIRRRRHCDEFVMCVWHGVWVDCRRIHDEESTIVNIGPRLRRPRWRRSTSAPTFIYLFDRFIVTMDQ